MNTNSILNKKLCIFPKGKQTGGNNRCGKNITRMIAISYKKHESETIAGNFIYIESSGGDISLSFSYRLFR